MIDPANEKVVSVEDSHEDTESLSNKNGDSDFDSMLESLSDYDDESLDSDVENMLLLPRQR